MAVKNYDNHKYSLLFCATYWHNSKICDVNIPINTYFEIHMQKSEAKLNFFDRLFLLRISVFYESTFTFVDYTPVP
jgi:hypothetical protein